ncbi:exodeoxyribonuclease VII large subunit [Umezakia ovalisporum]|uniref:exodeoxyribonuclease VII large subunit n=1 Tax=Umezakia ovalisporum TaxID=75695 RepID=UPI0035B773D4
MTFNSVIPDTALSVGRLTDYIRFLLEQKDELRQVWVTGEVSSASNHAKGLFFNLQDPNSTAVIKCVVWKSKIAKLAQMPTKGERLIILGSIAVYPQRGEYQLSVSQVIPAGAGLQALRYEQLKNRLLAEGLFDEQRKRALPLHPQIIAVVTSPTGAAWGDIQKTLKERYPGLQVLFSPATVQGEQAPDSIVKAINRVNGDGRAEVLILSRGGGAVEDLACFNDERVVRAVAGCSVPVITGIGHQRDESLADLVADVCVHTPTAAAETVVPSLSDLYIQHRQMIVALRKAVGEFEEGAEKKLQGLRHGLRRLGLDRKVQQEIQQLGWHKRQLVQGTLGRWQQGRQHLQLLEEKLASLDPKAVLQRGYAVVRRENGAIARSGSELAVGEDLLILLGQGKVKVKVTDIDQGDRWN